MEKQRERIYFLDEIRGLAILCMVVHHAFFDIGYLLNLQWGYDAFDFFTFIQPLFWFIFIVTSGLCTNLSRNSTKRGLLLLGISLGFTFVTAVVMPLFGFEGEEIYFGVLHCLAVCMIAAGLTKKLTDKVPPAAGMAVTLLLSIFTYKTQEGFIGVGPVGFRLPEALSQVEFLFPLGIVSDNFVSADYFPLLPWLFVFFFGVFLGKGVMKQGFPPFARKSRSRFLQFMGRNSLWVYVLHQPVLYAIFLPIKAIFF